MSLHVHSPLTGTGDYYGHGCRGLNTLKRHLKRHFPYRSPRFLGPSSQGQSPQTLFLLGDAEGRRPFPATPAQWFTPRGFQEGLEAGVGSGAKVQSCRLGRRTGLGGRGDPSRSRKDHAATRRRRAALRRLPQGSRAAAGQRTRGRAGREGDGTSYWLRHLPITEERSCLARWPRPAHQGRPPQAPW